MQSAIRTLTMPPVPNFQIPDSPPGSPPPSTTAKFDKFLELKTKGVHFNENIARSTKLRNPGLFERLMAHAGIDERDQYASALPEDLGVPVTFPPWAYGDILNKKQEEIRKKREDERRRGLRPGVEFVPASTASSVSSRGGTPSAAGKSDRRNFAERVMAGRDGEKSRSPQISDSGSRREEYQRDRDRDTMKKRKHMSRSRSPRKR
jgi:HCNGP-like protein